MTGHGLLQRARERAYSHDGTPDDDHTTAIIFDLINEVERLQRNAQGAAVICSAAQGEVKRLKKTLRSEKERADRLGDKVVELQAHRTMLRRALRQLLDADLDHTEAIMGRELKMGEMSVEWRRAHSALLKTDPFRGRGQA